MRCRLPSGALVLLLWTALCFGAVPARAETIIGNLPPANDVSGYGFNGIPGSVAMGFQLPVGTDYLLESATLRLQVNGADAAVTAQIWSDAGGNPNTLLAPLINPEFSIGIPVDYVFTPTASLTLQSGSTYWLVVARTAGTDSFAWTGNNPSITPTGIATHVGARIGGISPPTSPNSVLASYAIDANPIPEPGTVILFGLAAATLFARRRRMP